MKNIIILASGSGTNAENIAKYFKKHPFISVKMVLSNRGKAKVLERAKKLGIDNSFFSKEDIYKDTKLLKKLNKNADYVILAGFLLKIPSNIINAFPNKIINIHPALLPKYGGKGMYGMNVHNAVIENNEKESGITIHFVNENYDEGAIIFQKKVKITDFDTPKSLAEKIHVLEYEHFPKEIEKIILNNG